MWPAKAPGEVKRYTWEVPVQADDALASFTAVDSVVTVDSTEAVDNTAVVFLSGGTGGQIGTVVFTATTDNGETLVETVFIPVAPAENSNAFAATVDDIVDFALKPIVGLSGTATSTELDDGVEHLNGMLAMWRSQGADVGAQLPLVLATVIYAPDNWLYAIKNNLRVFVAEQYGQQVSPATAYLARNGLAAIKNDILRARPVTEAVYY